MGRAAERHSPRPYQKRPVVVLAQRLEEDDAHVIAAWCGGMVWRDPFLWPVTERVAHIDIPTLEGTMTADPGDWIIQGVEGEFYPCKNSVFQATYDPVAFSEAVPE